MSSTNAVRRNRTSRENYHHGDLEVALTLAAIELVRENGPDHLSLRATADQVGVSPSAVYHYFPDKDSLIRGVGKKLFEDLFLMQKEALDKIPGSSARAAKQRYRELGRTYFRWANREPNLFRLMFGGFCSSDFCSTEAQGSYAQAEAFLMLTKTIDDLYETGAISSKMRKYGELISWTSVQGASTLIVEGHLPEEAFETLLDGLELAMGTGNHE